MLKTNLRLVKLSAVRVAFKSCGMLEGNYLESIYAQIDAQTTLEGDISDSETSSLIPVGSQPSAARRKNAAQGISQDDSDDELEGIVSGPKQPNSIKLAVRKYCM